MPSHRYALKRAGLYQECLFGTRKASLLVYSQLLWEHARHPRNQGAMLDALVGTGRDQRCGDKLSLYLRVDDEERIREASFQVRACAPVVAVASLWSQEITGLSIDEARELSILELDRKLGDLPPSKRHAYLIFLECLNRALTTQTHQEKD